MPLRSCVKFGIVPDLLNTGYDGNNNRLFLQQPLVAIAFDTRLKSNTKFIYMCFCIYRRKYWYYSFGMIYKVEKILNREQKQQPKKKGNVQKTGSNMNFRCQKNVSTLDRPGQSSVVVVGDFFCEIDAV